jgi:predicted phosphodiesterase
MRECPRSRSICWKSFSPQPYRFYGLHDLKTLKVDPVVGIDVIVSGQSHVSKIDTVGGVLYVNPGSGTPALQAADHACNARSYA